MPLLLALLWEQQDALCERSSSGRSPSRGCGTLVCEDVLQGSHCASTGLAARWRTASCLS